MSISSILCNVRNRILPPAPIGMSDFIRAHGSRFGYWLRPSTPLQSQQMVGAYLKAMKDDLKSGGYIFVKKSRAADVLRQLTELEASYKVVNLKVMADIAEIINFHDPKELWVIVEDDSLPYEKLATRFKVAETALRSKMAPLLGARISEQEQREQLAHMKARGFTLMMFIEMDYPSIKGFSIVQAQCRSLKIASCRVSMDTKHDHELNAIFDYPEHNSDELKSRTANMLRIFGSGPNHYSEITRDLYDLSYDDPNLAPMQCGNSKNGGYIHIEKLKTASNLGIAVGFGDAQVLDMTK